MIVKLMGICACGAAALVLAQIAAGDSLASRHFEQEKNRDRAVLTSAAAMASGAQVAEIAIERCGPGRQYRAVIKSDGSVAYTGIKAVERVGEFTGTVGAGAFRELADYAVQISYFDLKCFYRAAAADRPAVYTSVKTGAAEKIIMNYAGKGPPALESFERKIEEVLGRAELIRKASAKVNP